MNDENKSDKYFKFFVIGVIALIVFGYLRTRKK